MALGSTQPLTEMSTRNILWRVKAAGAYGWQPYHLHVTIVLKYGSLNLLEPSGPVQACNGIALPFKIIPNRRNKTRIKTLNKSRWSQLTGLNQRSDYYKWWTNIWCQNNFRGAVCRVRSSGSWWTGCGLQVGGTVGGGLRRLAEWPQQSLTPALRLMTKSIRFSES
jgi:hypothetical protein